jgi:hypothetical protein
MTADHERPTAEQTIAKEIDAALALLNYVAAWATLDGAESDALGRAMYLLLQLSASLKDRPPRRRRLNPHRRSRPTRPRIQPGPG